MTHFRGSRKHILDVLDRPDCLARLNSMVGDAGIAIRPGDKQQPNGHRDPAEWTIRRFCREHMKNWGFDYEVFNCWWVEEQYMNPTWDLLSTCSIRGRDGLLMIEAKAHENELHTDAKPVNPGASDQSRINHERIMTCLRDSEYALNDNMPGFSLCQSHYQLCNRIASAWKVASCGVPVALLYLGFIGDKGIADVGTPFRDDAHWQSFIRSHMSGVVPLSFIEAEFKTDGTSMVLLTRSIEVLEVSSLRGIAGKHHASE